MGGKLAATASRVSRPFFRMKLLVVKPLNGGTTPPEEIWDATKQTRLRVWGHTGNE